MPTTSYYQGLGVDYYDLSSTGLPGDVPFYVQEAQRAGAPVLELACGTGRVTIPIAEAGVDVVGLDISEPMMARLRAKLPSLAPTTRERITIAQGDMRSFALGRRFGAVLIPYRAFLHNMTVDEQKATLRCVYEHLRPGGCLVLNVFDPNLEIIVGRSGEVGEALTRQGEFVRPDNGHTVIAWESRSYDIGTQIVQDYVIFDELDERGLVTSRAYETIRLRWVYRYEMEHLLTLCGFEVEALYGDFDRGPFVAGGEQIWVARRT